METEKLVRCLNRLSARQEKARHEWHLIYKLMATRLVPLSDADLTELKQSHPEVSGWVDCFLKARAEHHDS